MIDILIIGGGAAGMTAALYAKRSGKSVLIIEKESFGGQMAISPRIENYPSVKEISGAALAEAMFDQITDLGVDFECDRIIDVVNKETYFEVKGEFNTYLAQSVIIASGVKHKTLGLDSEARLTGKGVSYCAVCDGSFFKDEEVAVIGDANTALQYALLLTDICKRVHLCMLFDRFFADDILVQRVLNNPKIVVYKNISTMSFNGNEKLESITFKNTKTNELMTLEVSGAFVAIGQEPANGAFINVVELDSRGFIIANDSKTLTPGVFAAGDCRVKEVRQITTAISDGAVAACMAVNYLNKK